MKFAFRVLLVTCFLTAGISAQTIDFSRIIGSSAVVRVRDMAIQPDNKVVMFGACEASIMTGNVPFCGVRLNEDGWADGTFANSQYGVLTSPDGASAVNAVEVQSDGKVVAVGGGTKAVLVRYNTNGTLDTSFGTGGMVFTDFGGATSVGKAAIQPDGKIVLVGTSPDGQFVARYLPDGTLDSSFGAGGIVQANDKDSSGVSVALQPDGKIVVGGNNSVGPAFLITRYNSDGSLDTSWDGDGIKSIAYTSQGIYNNFFAPGGIRAIAVKLDGRIVALGHKNILFQVNADGSDDTTFDGDGSRQALNGTDKDPYSLIVSASGRITVVGATYGFVSSCGPFPAPCFGPTLYYLVARYNPDGTPDLTFASGNNLNINPGAQAGATAVVLDSQGRTVVAGIAALNSQTLNPWNIPVFSVARISAPPSVGPVGLSGRVTRPDGTPVGSAILILQGGSTTVTALTSPFGYYSFQNVPSGQAYAISPGSKKVMFDDRNVFVDGDVVGFNITSEPMEDNRPALAKPGQSIK